MLNEDLLKAIEGTSPGGVNVAQCVKQIAATDGINQLDTDGNTYLSLAACNPGCLSKDHLQKKYEIVKELLAAGADPMHPVQEFSVLEMLLLKIANEKHGLDFSGPKDESLYAQVFDVSLLSDFLFYLGADARFSTRFLEVMVGAQNPARLFINFYNDLEHLPLMRNQLRGVLGLQALEKLISRKKDQISNESISAIPGLSDSQFSNIAAPMLLAVVENKMANIFVALYRAGKIAMPQDLKDKEWADQILFEAMHSEPALEVRSADMTDLENSVESGYRNSLQAGLVNSASIFEPIVADTEEVLDFEARTPEEQLVEAIENGDDISKIKGHILELPMQQSDRDALRLIGACRVSNNNEALYALIDSGKVVIPKNGTFVGWAENLMSKRGVNLLKEGELVIKSVGPRKPHVDPFVSVDAQGANTKRVAAFKDRNAKKIQPDKPNEKQRSESDGSGYVVAEELVDPSKTVNPHILAQHMQDASKFEILPDDSSLTSQPMVARTSSHNSADVEIVGHAARLDIINHENDVHIASHGSAASNTPVPNSADVEIVGHAARLDIINHENDVHTASHESAASNTPVPVASPMGPGAKFFKKLAITVALALTTPLWVPAMLISFILDRAGITSEGVALSSYVRDQIAREWPDSAASQSPQRQYEWNNEAPHTQIDLNNDEQGPSAPQTWSPHETREVVRVALLQENSEGSRQKNRP